MLLRSDTEWKKRISVVQRERRRIDLLNGVQLSNDCARGLEPNINIFEKQAQMTQVLYSCGVQGAGPPPRALSAPSGGDQDLALTRWVDGSFGVGGGKCRG
jgi:hypothetical protein